MIAPGPQSGTVPSMLRSGLHANDARVGAAAQDLGIQVVVLTRDKRMLPFAVSF